MTLIRSVAILSALALGLWAGSPALAQPVVTAEPGIVVVGTGVATAPAEAATLQFLVMSTAAFLGPAPIISEPDAMASPEASGDWAAFGGPSRLTAEQVAPLIEALVANGVAEADITFTAPAAIGLFGPGGPEMGEIQAVIQEPQADQLPRLVQAAYDAAWNAGLQLAHIGARYDASDCPGLLQTARGAAIEDAHVRAAGVAAELEVELGEVIQVVELTSFGGPAPDSCAPDVTGGQFGPFGPGSLPAFDPDMTEARTTLQMMLVFAFSETGEG